MATPPSPLSRFAWDMTGDGAITISDVGQWVHWGFFLPGDLVIWALMLLEPIGHFLELSPAWYGGWVSGIFSASCWLTVAPMSLSGLFLIALTPYFLWESVKNWWKEKWSS